MPRAPDSRSSVRRLHGGAGNRAVAAALSRGGAADVRALARLRAAELERLPRRLFATDFDDALRSYIRRLRVYQGAVPSVLEKAREHRSALPDLVDRRQADRAIIFVGELSELANELLAPVPNNVFLLSGRFRRGGPKAVAHTRRLVDTANTLKAILAKWYEPLSNLGLAGQPVRKHFDPAPGLAVADYHEGRSAADAIPVVWYKRKEDYKSFSAVDYPDIRERLGRDAFNLHEAQRKASECKSKLFHYPNGPSLLLEAATRNRTVVRMTAPATFPFACGAPVVNVKAGQSAEAERGLQTAVREALKRQQADLSELDIDHVKDLGFGGHDKADNLWPLKETINRRPFAGWRTRYGLHYVDRGTVKAGVIAELQHRYFSAKAFMDFKEGPIPKEGGTSPPLPESGRSGGGAAPAPAAAARLPATVTAEHLKRIQAYSALRDAELEGLRSIVMPVREGWMRRDDTPDAPPRPRPADESADERPRKRQRLKVA
jgi:hypothetical protein